MDINIRIQQIVNEIHSCNKELYRRDEILPELLGTSAAANIACDKLGGDQ